MNRRELRRGMTVAFRENKYAGPRKAVVDRVDNSDGHGAYHTIKMVLNDGTVSDTTRMASSRQLTDWTNETEAVEEREFEQKKKEIADQLRKAELLRLKEPLEHLVGLLQLEGVEAEIQNNPYANARNGQRPFKLLVQGVDAFNALMQPILTKRATDRLFSPAQPETPVESSETDVEES